MEQTQAQRRFGTFSGVFTPSILTIFGVIMFLRTGFVVGNAGTVVGVLIIILAEVIVILTALSISAIATNVEVKVGGAYFLISRSLGVEFGGAIGLVLFLSQAISVAFYIVGFTEAFVASFQGLTIGFKEIAVGVLIILFIITFTGAGWAIKTQFVILAALGVSIVAFLLGATLKFDVDIFRSNLFSHYTEGYSLWKVFAIFFPAVTGILAGVNMSGDLKNPQKNIPRGVLMAIFTSTIVYTWIALLLAGNFERAVLANDSMAMRMSSLIPFSINIGVFAATLSSAIGSFMGAPRVLQALAGDGIFKKLRIFAKGSVRTNEPRLGIILTFFIALVGILIGDLNVIAPIITMFFLITYGMLNFATLYETVAANPSFRPRFRYFHWTSALFGVMGCLVIMMLINSLYAVISLILIFIIYKYVERRAISATWGDVTAGYLFSRTRQTLLRMDRETPHPKNWRPSILVMSGNPNQRLKLIQFAKWLEAGKGLIVLGNVVHGDIEDALQNKKKQERILQSFIEENNIESFFEVIVAEDFKSGVEALIQAAGVGKLKPNTVMFGLSYHRDRYEMFGKILRVTHLLGKNIIVAKPDLSERPLQERIDVWWRGMENGALMTLFAHLIGLNPEWRKHEKRILRLVKHEAEKKEALAHLQELIYRARIEATPEVLISREPFFKVMKQYSSDSSLVFLGLNIPKEGEEAAYFENLLCWLEGMSNVLLIKSTLDKDIILY